MTNHIIITSEAIDEAAEAIRVGIDRRSIWDLAKAAVEAAAPFIRAQALEDAAEQINAGSCEGNYSPEACETCRAVETLRDLATEMAS